MTESKWDRLGLIDAFLRELMGLCAKYDVSISGCGCCDSPSLDARNGSGYGGRLHVNGEGAYLFEGYTDAGETIDLTVGTDPRGLG